MSTKLSRRLALVAAATVAAAPTEDGTITLTIGDETIECKDLGDAVRALAGSDLFAQVVEALAADGEEGDGSEAEDGGEAPATKEDALLPERWVSGPRGVCMTEETGPERDFSNCSFTWRPTPLPLMMVVENEGAHYGAVWCGIIEEASGRQDGGVDMAGRFFADENGEAARNKALAMGKLPVSVDPSEYVTAEFECTEMDEDDFWCLAGKWNFTEYEIAGLTVVPMPGFVDAAIVIEGATAAAGEPPVGGAVVTAGATLAIPEVAPSVWFALDEPTDPEDPRLVPQPELDGSYAGRYAVPLTVLPTGQIFGHLAAWGTCHIGYNGVCVEPPDSPSSYARYMLGSVETVDGPVSTGILVAGLDHALHTMRAPAARDHYAHNGLAFADVRIVDGTYGPWLCGRLRPDVTEEQYRVIQASALSGDWRDFGGALDLVGAQLVNTPGFPILRELVASAGLAPSDAKLSYRVERGRVISLTAAGVVRRAEDDVEALTAAGTVEPCASCSEKRAHRSIAATTNARLDGLTDKVDRVLALVHALDARTRHLRSAAAADALRRIRRD